MDTVKIKKGNTLMVAHRGLSGIERENTNSAFVAAGNRSYWGIETDIHRTADGRFIVSHDMTLERVAGEKVSVEDVSLSVLESIVLFDKDGTKDRADLRPCTLENYISICKKYEKHCILELKSDFTSEEIKRIIEIIEGFGYLDKVTFISFYYDNLLKIRKELPCQSVQFLFSKLSDDIADRVISDRFDVDVRFDALTAESIQKFHDAGLKVNCWTVDKKEDAEQLVGMGVDYITSNILE